MDRKWKNTVRMWKKNSAPCRRIGTCVHADKKKKQKKKKKKKQRKHMIWTFAICPREVIFRREINNTRNSGIMC